MLAEVSYRPTRSAIRTATRKRTSMRKSNRTITACSFNSTIPCTMGDESNNTRNCSERPTDWRLFANNTMENSTTLHFGPHSLTYEAPDIMVIVVRGVFDGASASQVMEQLVLSSQGSPYMLYLMNVVHLSSFSSDARKIFTSNGHRLPPRVLSIFGGSFATQVILDLMDRASWLLGSRNRFTKHWPDEKSARAWATEMRHVLLAKTHAPT